MRAPSLNRTLMNHVLYLLRNSMRLPVLVVLVIALPFASFSARAEVRIIEIRAPTNLPSLENAPNSTKMIQIYGTIAQPDILDLERLLPSVRNFSISLNSNGGDVATAMAIGRILRREEKSAVVRANDVCVSACVLVLAGATHRAIFGGKVGIHRPFVGQDAALTPELQKAQYVTIERSVRQYLSEMNVDSRLYDDMFRISPSNVKYLTSSELRAYGLEGSDPYVEQSYYARRAKDLGISTQELLRRQSQADKKCRQPKTDYGKCYLAIEIGISDSEYARRDSVAQTTCAALPTRVEFVRCHDRIIHGAEK